MAVVVSCPACGAKLKAPDEKAGKKARCGKCGGKVRIPGPAPLADSVGESQMLSAIMPAPLPEEDDEPVPMAGAVEEFDSPPPPASANPFDFSAPPASKPPAEKKPEVRTASSPPGSSNPGRPAFGSGSTPKAAPISPPPPVKPPKPPKPPKAAEKKPEVHTPDPTSPAQEMLSLDDEPLPVIPVGEPLTAPPVGKPIQAPGPKSPEPKAPAPEPVASDDPFAFTTGPAPAPKPP